MSPPRLRAHHREHAVEHGVAGEQDPLLLEQEAEVVRRVPGRVQHLEPELGALDRVALADDAVGHDRGVLVEALAVGEHLGAGRLHQSGGAGRVVGMGVGEQHPAHPLLHRRADDGVDVALVVGTGVDHRDLVDADEVGVGAGAGERTRVRRHDPADERRQRARDAGSQVRHRQPHCSRRDSARTFTSVL